MSPLRHARFEIPLVRREIEEQGATYRYALVLSEIVAAPDWLRARMGLEPGAELRHLVCLHFADGSPYQHEERWINLGLLPQAREVDFTEAGPNEWLVAQVCHLARRSTSGVASSVSVSAPSGVVAQAGYSVSTSSMRRRRADLREAVGPEARAEAEEPAEPDAALAAALNLVRLTRWIMGVPIASARVSPSPASPSSPPGFASRIGLSPEPGSHAMLSEGSATTL